MKRWILCWCVLSSCALYGQKLTFEEASIKASEGQPMGQLRIGMSADNGLMRYNNVSLKDCVRVANRVKDFQVEGPDWLGTTRFDITAKLPAGSTREQIPEMLQTLLEERFKLKFHRDKKEHAIFALVAGKGRPKLKAADIPKVDGAPAGANSVPRGAMSIMVDGGGAHLKAPAVTLTNLADMMSRFTERPVIDMTAIEGQYEFDLVFSPENMQGGRGGGMLPPPPPQHEGAAAAGEPVASIADSVRAYGLKLEPRKAPMDVLIVDHMEKTPTEN